MLLDACNDFLQWLDDSSSYQLPDSLVVPYTQAHLAFRSAVLAWDDAYEADCLMDLVEATSEILRWYSDTPPASVLDKDAYIDDYRSLVQAYRSVVVSVS